MEKTIRKLYYRQNLHVYAYKWGDYNETFEVTYHHYNCEWPENSVSSLIGQFDVWHVTMN